MDWDATGKDDQVGSLRLTIGGEYVNRKVRKWYPIAGMKDQNAGELELEIIHVKPDAFPQGPQVVQRGFAPPPQGYAAPGFGQPPPQGYAAPGFAQPPQVVYVQPAPIIVVRSGPTRLYLQQKVFTWGDKFEIRDDSGAPVFRVNGEVFTIGKKLHVLDLSGEEVAYIHEKVLTLWAQYEVEIRKPDVLLFTVKREYKIGFGHNFNVLGLNWVLKGDFGAHDYHVYRDAAMTQEVFYMHKHWMSWGDSYEMIIHDPSTVLPCVCIALSIDAFLAKDQGNDSDHPHHRHHRSHH